MNTAALIDRLYNGPVGRTRAARKSEDDIYLPIQLPPVELIRKLNPEAISISRNDGGPLIVCYVSIYSFFIPSRRRLCAQDYNRNLEPFPSFFPHYSQAHARQKIRRKITISLLVVNRGQGVVHSSRRKW
jgi:hypothetical protein